MTGMGNTFASELTEVGAGLELATAPGVAVAPTFQIVVDKAPDASDSVGKIEDKGLRGSMVETWDIVAGVTHAMISLSGPVMGDTLPYLAANILGDTIYQGTPSGTATALSTGGAAAGVNSAPCVASIPSGSLIQIDIGLLSEVRTTTGVTGSGPYTVTWSATQPLKISHAAGAVVTVIVAGFTTIQSLLNAGNYYGGQAQPPTLTITDMNQVSANYGRQYAGWSLDSLSIKSSPNGLLTFEAKGSAFPSATLASVPTLPVSAVPSTAGWRSTVNLSGGAMPNITEWGLDLTRKTSIIDTTDGTQAPYAIRRGSLGVSTKFRVVAVDETPLLTYLAQTAVPIVYAVSNGLGGAATVSESFNLPKVKYIEGTKIDRSKEEVAFTVEASVLPSTSAAGWSGGASHVQLTSVNAIAPNTYSL
jgi:hypothetical protein